MGHAQFVQRPFEHWLIEGALDKGDVQRANECWPAADDVAWAKEQGRFSYKWSQPATVGYLGRLMQHLMSAAVRSEVAALLGVSALYADDTQFGGGLHEIPFGGYLLMHTDFQYHRNGYKRAANLLVYLNTTWKERWRGGLRLGGGADACEYAPIGGRAVLFRTTTETLHGHPEPLHTPDGVTRRSMAVYYYTRQRGEPDTTRYIKGKRHE